MDTQRTVDFTMARMITQLYHRIGMILLFHQWFIMINNVTDDICWWKIWPFIIPHIGQFRSQYLTSVTNLSSPSSKSHHHSLNCISDNFDGDTCSFCEFISECSNTLTEFIEAYSTATLPGPFMTTFQQTQRLHQMCSSIKESTLNMVKLR